ncbi:transglutaminase domain-containing protein [Kitasatospora sp. NPDC048365]|uniref:transglutaminase domain-containing protein n=1 Tax=Kitasatospora sp. NPDC048365 TaxID=3364050 RepID=UPI00371998E0
MTCAVLTPWWRARVDLGPAGAVEAGAAEVGGGTAPTPILDREHPRVRALVRAVGGEGPPVERLRRAHRLIVARVRPVYSVEDLRPVSEVLRRGRGSCSQRLAVLEAVARAGGVPTRVRGLVVDGTFWYPRFPRLRRIVPDRVVLAWPEFRIDGGWVSVGELFGAAAGGGAEGGFAEDGFAGGGFSGGGFANRGSETLFEALARTPIDWDGPAVCPADGAGCDLSAYVLADLGRFDSRDELFARHGQTLCGPARLVAEPVLGRWAAGAAA